MSRRQGQSISTIDKERRISSALTVNMRITERAYGSRRFRYWHFDANAGSGWNDEVDVPGSPVVFWDRADAFLVGMRPTPFFCDINTDRLSELKKRLADLGKLDKSVLIPGDNQEAIEVFAEYIRGSGDKPCYAAGSVLIDPNGYYYRARSGEGAPCEAMDWFTREFPRIDLILNLNVRWYLMARRHEWGRAVMPPVDVLQSLNRSHWLVARAGGQSRNLLAIGRNISLGDHKALGLYDWESEPGRAVLNPSKDHDDVPELF